MNLYAFRYTPLRSMILFQRDLIRLKIQSPLYNPKSELFLKSPESRSKKEERAARYKEVKETMFEIMSMHDLDDNGRTLNHYRMYNHTPKLCTTKSLLSCVGGKYDLDRYDRGTLIFEEVYESNG